MMGPTRSNPTIAVRSGVLYERAMRLILRRADLADAQTLSTLGRETFIEAFGSLYPPSDLATFLAAAHDLERIQRDLADPAKATWLLELSGVAIGYALAGPCDLPHPDVRSSHGELKRIYVRKAHQGGGRGTMLLNEALAWLEKDGPRPLWLGVYSENLGAQRLYARRGFERAGEYLFPVGKTRDIEFILRRG